MQFLAVKCPITGKLHRIALPTMRASASLGPPQRHPRLVSNERRQADRTGLQAVLRERICEPYGELRSGLHVRRRARPQS
jgi:hypothetical protein